MPTQNVNLPDHQADFIRDSVAGGRYKNASEVVRAGLRLLEQQEAEDQAKLEVLQRIAKESIAAYERGEYTTHTIDSLHAMMDRIGEEVRSRHGRGK